MNRLAKIIDIFDGQLTASQNFGAGDVQNYSESQVALNVTAVAGTSPTLDIDYQVSLDDGVTWFTKDSFAQATTTGTELITLTAPIGVRGRFVCTLGGTAPDFTFTLKQELKSV